MTTENRAGPASETCRKRPRSSEDSYPAEDLDVPAANSKGKGTDIPAPSRPASSVTVSLLAKGHRPTTEGLHGSAAAEAKEYFQAMNAHIRETKKVELPDAHENLAEGISCMVRFSLDDIRAFKGHRNMQYQARQNRPSTKPADSENWAELPIKRLRPVCKAVPTKADIWILSSSEPTEDGEKLSLYAYDTFASELAVFIHKLRSGFEIIGQRLECAVDLHSWVSPHGDTFSHEDFSTLRCMLDPGDAVAHRCLASNGFGVETDGHKILLTSISQTLGIEGYSIEDLLSVCRQFRDWRKTAKSQTISNCLFHCRSPAALKFLAKQAHSLVLQGRQVDVSPDEVKSLLDNLTSQSLESAAKLLKLYSSTLK
eukprot:TRINITY_DN11936_c0_g1_i2.p1 TRINITY_DN11936_c0_g1~~TRINITY_DN11936_c0_g1_i2.p1  ORF type:complete len:370 (-),score=42.43 TRINITY_DN11936_c0_g1_i2:64-1173(-)